jgi:hypothetical protein
MGRSEAVLVVVDQIPDVEHAASPKLGNRLPLTLPARKSRVVIKTKPWPDGLLPSATGED